MSVYVLAPNGVVEKYPYTLTDMRIDNPTVSFPIDITDELAFDFSVYPVEATLAPSYNEDTERLLWVNPEFTNGSWKQRWSVEALSTEELQSRLEQWRLSATCTPFQGKAALLDAGLLDAVEALIAAPNTDRFVKLAWANAGEWRRLSPRILSLMTALGVSDSQADQLFKTANNISA